jgi:hypothetical protein
MSTSSENSKNDAQTRAASQAVSHITHSSRRFLCAKTVISIARTVPIPSPLLFARKAKFRNGKCRRPRDMRQVSVGALRRGRRANDCFWLGCFTMTLCLLLCVQTRSLGCELWRVVVCVWGMFWCTFSGSRAWGIGTKCQGREGEANFGTSR